MEITINYLVVIVSAISSIVLGFLWYGPIFGKKWIKLMGWTEEHISEAQKKGMTKQYILMALGSLIMAYVMAHSVIFGSSYLGVAGVMAGVQAGFWNWLGFIAPVLMGNVLWEGKSWALWILNSGYYLVSLMIMGIILSSWV